MTHVELVCSLEFRAGLGFRQDSSIQHCHAARLLWQPSTVMFWLVILFRRCMLTLRHEPACYALQTGRNDWLHMQA